MLLSSSPSRIASRPSNPKVRDTQAPVSRSTIDRWVRTTLHWCLLIGIRLITAVTRFTAIRNRNTSNHAAP